MSENTAGLYHEPAPEEAHLYEQRGDGKWYYKDTPPCEETHLAAALGNRPCNTCGEDSWTREKRDEPAVGDLDSDAVGSGARLNSGKPRYDLIPVRAWLEAFKRQQQRYLSTSGFPDDPTTIASLLTCVQALAEYQEGKGRSDEMMASVPFEWYELAAAVFEYGASKYKAWNWLKGMPWSVPTASALRHAKAILVDDELTDDESLLPHLGHFVCNLIMLATYADTYPEGNDYPKEEYFSER